MINSSDSQHSPLKATISQSILPMVLLITSQLAPASDVVMIHAIHEDSFSCSEHWDGQLPHLGDALGTDCVITGWYQDDKRLFKKTFINDGFDNEDWFGFKQPVLAPCDCTVVVTHQNTVTNQPGVMTPGRAASITFKNEDNQYILLAHVRDIQVAAGDQVSRGQVVAKVGNNGYSRNPHIHVGAWDQNKKPMQIRFDQKTLGLKARKNKIKKISD